VTAPEKVPGTRAWHLCGRSLVGGRHRGTTDLNGAGRAAWYRSRSSGNRRLAAMSRISFRRPHHMGHDEAVKTVDRIAKRLANEHDVEIRWQGDTLRVEGDKFHGTLAVEPDDIVVDIRLGFRASLFRPVIEREVKGFLDKELGPTRA
jgi:putative polyhydroxyalkanoate system protein